MKRILFIISLFILAFQPNIMGQKAEKLMNQLSYSRATDALEKDLVKDAKNATLRQQLAKAYAKTGNIESSLYHYNQIVYSDSTHVLDQYDWNNIGQYNLAGGNLEDATKAFRLAHKNAYKQSFQNPDRNLFYKIENIEGLNTTYSEFSPFVYENQIVFTSDRPATPYDINKSDWSGNSFLATFAFENEKVKIFDSRFNELYHIGPMSYAADKKWMFMTKAFRDNKTEISKTKLYYSKLENGKWSKPESISILNSEAYSSAHPVFIEKFNILVFASDMPGGMGGMDLYYSKYENGAFQEPVNFGEKINTPFNEVFPTYSVLTPDVIYFSSNGHVGHGGLDVFSFKWDGKLSKDFKLLPKSINSSRDDFGMHLISDTSGYISSNRTGSLGLDDIFYFEKSNTVNISGFLVDLNNKPLANKKLYLYDKNSLLIDSIYSEKDGHFVFSKLPYASVSILPESENGVEMFIRNRDKHTATDGFDYVYLKSSKNNLLDEINLSDFYELTLILESYDEMITRCVQFEDGTKAVKITFAVKDKEGNFIEKVTTNNQGCLVLKKLYENAYLEILDELQNELSMRFRNTEDEKRFQIIKEEGVIVISSNNRCVVYEDGTEVKNFVFVVKDTLGNVIDTIYTDEKGCFRIKKLYNQKTYLDLLDEDKLELGFRFKNTEDEMNISWQKDNRTITIKTPTKCAVYSDGEIVANKEIVVKDENGIVLTKFFTDKDGCFLMKKLKGDNFTLELIDEEEVTLTSRMKNQESQVVFERNLNQSSSNLIGFIKATGSNVNDYSSLNVVLYSEDGVEKKRTVVNKLGAFEFKKLSENQDLLMKLIDDDNLLIKSKKVEVSGVISNQENLKSNKIYLLNDNNEKYKTTTIDKDGKFKFNVDYKELEASNNKQKEEHFEEVAKDVSKTDKIVTKNIYFDYGKWDLNVEAENILDDLAKLMKSNPDLKVIINAHTDANGRTSKNLLLSQNRANSVKVYLRSKGVKSSQMETHGYGETKLLNRCVNEVECSDEEHAVNRRIEFEFKWKR